MAQPVAPAAADEPARASHIPFRSWALQHDLISLLGGSADWRSNSLDTGAADRQLAANELGGQAYLQEALAEDPRFELRTRTSLLLWAAALITDILNQASPFAVGMPAGSFVVTIGGVILAMVITAIFYPRIGPRQFAVLEQTMLGLACALILYQCAVTGGSSSPYTSWFILTTIYAGYLLPAPRAIANVIAYSLGVLGTIVLSQTNWSGHTLIALLTLLVVIWVTAITLIAQHRNEVTLRRAVNFLALADPLTGVANLRAFEQYLDRMARVDGQRFGVVMADMNGLKGANTVFGHDIGDGMIERLARLMMASSHGGAQVARIGGDEFAVVVPSDEGDDSARWVRRFEQAVEEHNVAARGRLPRISVSLGVATYPDDGVSTGDLLDSADRRMYEQKAHAVTPPFELDEPAATDAGHQYREARFADTPRQPTDTRDRLRFASLSWIALGSILLAAAAANLPNTLPGVTAACGVVSMVMAGVCEFGRAHGISRPAVVLLDATTLMMSLPAVWSTGGGDSPILIAGMLPVAFYAQHFASRLAIPRLAAVFLASAIGFSITGSHGDAQLTTYATTLAAIAVVAFVMQFSLRTQQRALNTIRDSATHDPLTKLPNAYALRADLESAIGRLGIGERWLGLIVVDLDNFRRANTASGHRGGDTVLQVVGERLYAIREGATAYRIGGDEFAVVVGGEAGRNTVARVAQQCVEAVALTVPVPGADPVAVTGSAGYAEWNAGSSGDDLMTVAEESLRTTRAERRGTGGPERSTFLL